MRANFGLFCSSSPKLPRIHVYYVVMQIRKTNREKGYYGKSSKLYSPRSCCMLKPIEMLTFFFKEIRY